MEYLFGGSPGMSPKPFVTPTPSPIVIHLATHWRARIVAALSSTLTTLRNRVAVLSRSKADFWGREQWEKHNLSGMGVNWIQLRVKYMVK
jgi:hypothetical protein